MQIIAEIGQNHNGDMGLAREMIRCAKECGADTAKFQLFDADAVFGKQNNPWYEYNRSTQLSQDQVVMLAGECRRVGIEFFASVFDSERVKWLEAVGVSRYKIASRTIHDGAVIEALAKTGKPLLVSLGIWKGIGFPVIPTDAPVEFLYCVTKYPAPLEELRLSEVDFSTYAGFSDHSLGITAALVAFSRGARIVEKHFTLDKAMYGPDHSGSMTPYELSRLHKARTEIKACL